MSKQAIISLALLKVNWDRYQKSYTDNFAPLAAECIRASGLPVISVSDLQARMLAEFGLRIPAHSLRVVLERLKKKGLVKQDHKVYVPIPNALAKLSIAENRQKVLDQHRATVANLIEYCETKYNVHWSEKQAEDALISYLKEYDLDVLRASADGSPLPEIAQPVRNAHFLVNAFVREIAQNSPVAFHYLETIVKGHLLANALVFPEIGEIARKFDRTSVYFDTRPILNALGYGGAQYRLASADLLDLLYETGANLRCFRHTYDEIHGILNACANSCRGGADAPVGVALVFQGGPESDVLLAMAALEKDIQKLRIKIEEKPAYVPEHQISETELDGALQHDIGYVHDLARTRDVDSLSAIFRLRRGREYHCIEECRAIFVTTNPKLVRCAANFFASYQSQTAPPICISDHHLTNILWLKKPMLHPDLPKKRIMADAYAAMEPSGDLWRKFLAEVERLRNRRNITADEYLLLRNSIEVRAHLMDITLGDEEALVEGTVAELLEAYNANLIADAEGKRRAAEAREHELEAEIQEASSRISDVATAIARIARWSLFTLFVLLLLLGGYSSYASGVKPPWLRQIFTWTAFLVATASVASLIRGGTVESVTRGIEGTLRRYLDRVLKKWLLGAAGASNGN